FLHNFQRIIEADLSLPKLFCLVCNCHAAYGILTAPLRVHVNIQQSPDISVAHHAMIEMPHPVGPQDADIEAVLLFYDFVVPYGKINIKIEAGDHIVAPADKSSTHGLSLSCGWILY